MSTTLPMGLNATPTRGRSTLNCFAWVHELLCCTKERSLLNELEMHLYLDQIHAGPKTNQQVIINATSSDCFGCTAVNDWPLYDGRGPGKKVIARARGMHIKSSRNGGWSVYMSLVFEDDKFKDSTLEVMGINSWAIVGGTGEFTRAEGIIHKKNVEHRDDGDVLELHIHAFYSPLPEPMAAA